MCLSFEDNDERNTIVSVLDCICTCVLAESNLYECMGEHEHAKRHIKAAEDIQNIQREIQFHCNISQGEYLILCQILSDPPENMSLEDKDGTIKRFLKRLNSEKKP